MNNFITYAMCCVVFVVMMCGVNSKSIYTIEQSIESLTSEHNDFKSQSNLQSNLRSNFQTVEKSEFANDPEIAHRRLIEVNCTEYGQKSETCDFHGYCTSSGKCDCDDGYVNDPDATTKGCTYKQKSKYVAFL